MKKADISWIKGSKQNFDRERYEEALRYLEKHKDSIKSHAGVTGIWVGSMRGEPYIMVALEPGLGEEAKRSIPDRLGKYEVYYVEGNFHL